MRTTLAATALGAALAVAPAAPAAAEDYCAGFPESPATYVCLTLGRTGEPGPAHRLTIGEFCYLVGCTAETPVDVPAYQFSDQPLVVVRYNGVSQEVGLGSGGAWLLSELGYAACVAVAQTYNGLGVGTLDCGHA